MVVGVSVGVAVVLVRLLTPDASPLRPLALALAVMLLTVLHFVLRQSVREMPPSKPLRFTTRRSRPSFDDVFAAEAEASWTGLADPPPEVRRERL